MEDAGGTGQVVEATAGAATAPALPAYGHEAFGGTFRMKLPANGRVVLPATLRKAFGDAGKIRSIDGRFLNLWTPLAHKLVAGQVRGAGGGLVSPRSTKRFFMTTTDVTIDSQGRFVLSKELRDAVGIRSESEIVLAGAIEAIEIWPADRFDEEEEPTMSDVDLLLGNYEGLEP